MSRNKVIKLVFFEKGEVSVRVMKEGEAIVPYACYIDLDIFESCFDYGREIFLLDNDSVEVARNIFFCILSKKDKYCKFSGNEFMDGLSNFIDVFINDVIDDFCEIETMCIRRNLSYTFEKDYFKFLHEWMKEFCKVVSQKYICKGNYAYFPTI